MLINTFIIFICKASSAGNEYNKEKNKNSKNSSKQYNLFFLRFGPPFLMREDRSVSWDQLQQSILSKLYYLMINGAQPQVVIPTLQLTV